MKRAFIFTGQGEELGVHNPQLVTFWMSIALAKILIANNIKPDAVAGLSLGEYACFAIANVFSVEELEQILVFRQKIMDDALKNTNTGMVACIGVPVKEIEEMTTKHGLFVTNYNSPMQTVVGGEKTKINELKDALQHFKNASMIDLQVTGAFHSPYLNDASEKMRKFLDRFSEKTPTIPIYCNLTGKKIDKNIRETMVKHLVNPVQFQGIIENMLDNSVDEFISIGIGSTPVNLIRQICKERGVRAKVKKVESLEDIERIIK